MSRTDPHSYFDPTQPRTDHVDLTWDVDFSARRIRGSATLTLKAPGAGPMDLDSRGLAIASAKTSDGRPVPFELGAGDAILGSRLRLDLPAGTTAVTLAYETSPEAVALQWLEPSQTLGGLHPFLFSQCQPHHARTLAPLQDSPVARVTYTAAVTVPEGLRAVMSAGPDGDVPAGAGRRTFRFKMPQRIPSYLLALAVGDLAAREIGPRSTLYAEPGAADAAAWEFGEIESMIRKAETLFGAYEWTRYDLLVLPPSFPYGGMENPRLTFLTPTLVAGDRSLVTTVVHELAHSWTGNLVTNATVEHFWLNEGFTVWAERRILESLRGEEAAVLAWALDRVALDKAIDRFGPDSPFTKLQTELEGVDPDDVFSEVPYYKGALFLALLERTVGRPAFDRFIRLYIDHFRFTSITTDELLAFVEEKLPGALAKVDAARWIHGTGLPADAPVFRSTRLDAVRAHAAAWVDGARPSAEVRGGWSADETLLFLKGLPRPLPEQDCAWLEREMGLESVRNYEIAVEWLTVAAASDYAPCFPRVREVLSTVGRMKYLRPLYGALAASPRTRALALDLFGRTQGRLHMLSRQVVEAVLKTYPAA